MNRRDALAATATLLGVTLTGSAFFLNGCSPAEKKISSLNELDTTLLDEIGETILPESASSPGAKAARIGEFMKIIVKDCYTQTEQDVFVAGVNTLNTVSRETYQNNFIDLNSHQKTELLTRLDKEAEAFGKAKEDDQPEHYYTMLKQLSLWGYFTSEPGATKALRYVPIPGRYEGCIDYNPGDGAWIY